MTAPADRADELARRLLLLSVLAQRVAEAKTEVKDELAKLVKVGTMLRPQLGGRNAGSVTYTRGRSRAEVYSESEYLAWVRLRYPEYVHLEPVVDRDFRAKCLVTSEQAGEAVSPFGDVDVGGIRAARGEPFLAAHPDKSRAAELWQEIRANELIGELDSEGEMA